VRNGPSDRRPKALSWLIVATITAALTFVSTRQSLDRYHAFRSGWAWDLAYYNQWFWALTVGDREITVRPLSRYAEEGPSVWKTNYLAPIRFALAPIYRLFPDPRTLLVIQNIMFWWVVPAAYTLVRSESGSRALAVSAAALVPLAPLLWPLVLNDFRELQLALPFVVWAIQGVRSRSAPLAVLGIAGMLACRQEFAVMAATFALIPSRQPEPLSATLRWRHLIVFTGLSWMLIGFLGYLRFAVGRNAPAFYVAQFLDPKAALSSTLHTSLEALVYGLGVWAVLACFAPRIAILALPWIWGPCSGQWSVDSLSTSDWHHVRYALPMTALVLAAGLIGYARVGTWILNRRGFAWAALAWAILTVAGAAGTYAMKKRIDEIPRPIGPTEAAALWRSIEQVGPNDGVLADHVVSAPLSSRRRLYGYLVNWNLPVRYPKLGPGIRWLFIRNDYPLLKVLLDQGFQVVQQGERLTVAHRNPTPENEKSDFLEFRANTKRR
jgi:Predicted membrane protein (DUF2079)